MSEVEFQRFDQWDERGAAINARAVKMGNICPNQFSDEHEELAFGLGRALGVDSGGDHYEDAMENAQRIANKYAIAVKVDVYMQDPVTDFTWGETVETVEPKKN